MPKSAVVETREFSRDVLIVTLIMSLVHGLALWFQDDLLIEYDFTRDSGPQDFIIASDGWASSPRGLIPQAGRNPVFSVGISKSPFENLFLDVRPTPQGHGKVAIQVVNQAYVWQPPEYLPAADPNGAPWHLHLGRFEEGIDASGLVQTGQPVNLNQIWPGGGAAFIILTPQEDAQGPLIQSLQLRRSVWMGSLLLIPCFWSAVAAVFLYAIAVTDQLNGRRVLCIALVLLGGISILMPIDVLEWSRVSAAAAALIGGIALVRRHRPRLAVVTLLFTMLFLAAFSRFDVLSEARFRPLDPDAQQFRAIAQSMHWFYDTNDREPLFILLIKGALLVFGDEDFSVRLVSLAGSLALIPVIWWAGQEVRGPVAGFVAAALVAGSTHWATQSVRGLRLEFFTLTLVVLTAGILTQRVLSLRRHALWLGLASAAVCLIRLTSLWFCLLGIAYGLYRRGWSTKAFLLATAITVVPLVPFVIRSAVDYGDPMHAANKHIKFYRNQEFKDQPGFPTSDELEKHPYAGPHVDSVEYFFRMHSLGELTHRAVKQFTEIFFSGKLRQLTCDGNQFLQWWAVLSYGVLACSRFRMLLPWMLMLIGPIVWLYAPTSEPEWRLIFHVSVFNYLCMGLAVAIMHEAHGLQAAGFERESLKSSD